MLTKSQISDGPKLSSESSNIFGYRVLWCIPFICLMLYSSVFENDTFWLLNTGKYILANGFPAIDPFTMHSGLRLTVQQWLTTVVFYKLYETFGDVSIIVLSLLAYIGISIIIYFTCLAVDDSSRHFTITITVFSAIALSFYIVPRPQIFSILIFSAELLLLEMFVKHRNSKVLFLLPVLSVLLINLHAAMWVIFFLLFAPYILDGFNFSILGIKSQGYGIKGLAVSFLASLMAGFINPYGLDNMLYLIYSYGNKSISTYIVEMKSPNFQNAIGIFLFIILAVTTLVYSLTKNNRTLRHTLLCLGTAFLGLSSIRSFVFFILCAGPMTASSLKGIVVPDRPVNKKITVLIASVIVIIGLLIIVNKDYKNDEYLNSFKPEGAASYIINNINPDKLVLYNEFHTGGYLEYRGIKTFIDSRAEVFIKSFNKKEDIFEDYINIITGKKHYKELEDKYGFTHYLVSKNDLLNTYLSKDTGYKAIYEDDKFVLFEKR